jgi:hypothetical protein
MTTNEAMVCTKCKTLYHHFSNYCPECMSKNAISLYSILPDEYIPYNTKEVNRKQFYENMIQKIIKCYNKWKDKKISTRRNPFTYRSDETWEVIKEVSLEYQKKDN